MKSLLKIAILASALLAPSRHVCGQSSSASFRLVQSTLDASGLESTSSAHRQWGSIGQELSIGTSSSAHAVLQAGFWSFLGSGLVPVLLTVGKNVGVPAHPDLMWTGNNPPYTVYRSTACAGVFSSVLAVEPANSHTDASAFPAGLTCYNVLATAPGPFTFPLSRAGAASP